MHKELEVMKPRCKGLWRKCSAIVATMYLQILTVALMLAKAADKKATQRIPGRRCNRWN